MSLGAAKHERGTTLGSNPELYPYVLDHINELPIQKRLRDDIATLERSQMMGAPDEAQFLGWLVSLIQAKTVVEVGVFRGSTTLAIALQLPHDGKIIGLDVSEEFAELGKKAWAEAGVTDKIDFRVGPAAETMEHLIAHENLAGHVDLIFIDADKPGYDTYYELGLRLLRKGGVIVIDNVLWSGKVIQPIEDGDDSTKALVAISAKVKKDTRVSAVMLPIADGAYLVRKL